MRPHMTREEYNEILATEPATPTQVGAVMGEWRRLGLDHPDDRADRLALTAQLLGVAEVGSTRDLVMGDAGRLVAMLRGASNLDAVLPALEPEPVSPSVRRGPWWMDVPAQVRPLFLEACRAMRWLRDSPAVASDHDQHGPGAGLRAVWRPDPAG